jgi:homoaconitase
VCDSAGDVVETVGLNELLRGNVDAQIKIRVTKSSGDVVEIPVEHTVSADQVSPQVAVQFP